MKETGIIRHVDQLGRVVLPHELRRIFDLEPGTPVEIFGTANGIFLQKHESTCTFCGSADGLILHCGRRICRTCQAEIAQKESPEA